MMIFYRFYTIIFYKDYNIWQELLQIKSDHYQT